MRSSVTVFLFLLLSVSASADVKVIKVKVLDPQSAAVAGAQVSLLRAGQSTVLAIQTTGPEGATTFHLESADGIGSEFWRRGLPKKRLTSDPGRRSP